MIRDFGVRLFVVLTFGTGQKRKDSERANVVWFAPESGPPICPLMSARP
jgi:hypothetical protein